MRSERILLGLLPPLPLNLLLPFPLKLLDRLVLLFLQPAEVFLTTLMDTAGFEHVLLKLPDGFIGRIEEENLRHLLEGFLKPRFIDQFASALEV